MRVSKEKAAQNRERILNSAARLFREHGIDATGVDAITEDAGLTHGGLYSQFGSKEVIAAEDVADSKETILAVEGDVVVVEVVAWKEEGQRRIALEANSDPMHNNMGFIAFIAASLALILVQMA